MPSKPRPAIPIDELARRRAGGGRSIAISRSSPRRLRGQGRQAPDGRRRTSKVGGCGSAEPVARRWPSELRSAQKYADAPTPHPHRDCRRLRSVEASSPGTMSAGAESARATTPRQARRSPAPSARQLGVVERVEDPVALGDVEVGLLRRRHRPSPALSRPGESAGARQLVDAWCRWGSRAERHLRRLGFAPPADCAAPRRAQPPRQAARRALSCEPDGRPHFRQVHVLQDRSRLAPPRRRAARRRQARVPRRLRGLRARPLAARLLNHRHAGRRRPAPAQPEPDPRRHPHLPRRARPERPGEVGGDPLLLPLDDQEVALLRGGRRGPRSASPSASTCSSTRWSSSAAGTGCRPRSAGGS